MFEARKLILLIIFAIASVLLAFQVAHTRVTIDVRDDDPDIIIYGVEIFDGLGYPLFVEDINGDGMRDIIISATASDGPEHSKINCGTIYVVFGKDSLPPSVQLSSDVDLIIYGPEHGINGIEGDEAGYALASTDLNNDGINDLIISGIYADGPDNTRPDCGEVYIIFGQYDYPKVMDLSVDADIIIYGVDGGEDPDKGDMLGYALATGDLNSDGLEDLVISGVKGHGPQNTRHQAGETYIMWGKKQLSSVIDLANSTDVTTIWGAEAGDLSGFALFVKDLNGDNFEDLMIAALMADGPSNCRENSGETYIIYGRDSFPSTIDLATDADVIIYGAEAGDQGFNPVNYIGSGDVNGDGLADLVIGAPFADGEMNQRVDSGETYIVLGTSPLPQTIDLATEADTVIYGVNREDESGFCIAIGDVNGDKIDDICINAVNGDGPYDVIISSGEAYVVYGRESFPSVLDLSDADVCIYGADPFDVFGIIPFCADVNNDGIDDILFGVPGSDGFDNSIEDAGEVTIIFGATGGIGLDTISPKDEEIISCQPAFKWTSGHPDNNIWVFQLFEAPDGSHLLHTSPFLLEPTYALPDNFLADIPANRPLYWGVYGTNPNLPSPKEQKSQLFSFTREGLHLLSPKDSSVLSSFQSPILKWTSGCSENTSWVVQLSEDPDFASPIVTSPTLNKTSWHIPDTTWQTLPRGIPIYWKVMGYYQPVEWRVLLEWSQEKWSFLEIASDQTPTMSATGVTLCILCVFCVWATMPAKNLCSKNQTNG